MAVTAISHARVHVSNTAPGDGTDGATARTSGEPTLPLLQVYSTSVVRETHLRQLAALLHAPSSVSDQAITRARDAIARIQQRDGGITATQLGRVYDRAERWLRAHAPATA